MHTHTRSRIPTDRQTDRQTYIHTTYIHATIHTYIGTYIHTYMAASRLLPFRKIDPPRQGHAVQIHVRIRRIRKDGCFRRRHLSIFHLFSIEAMHLQSFFMKEGEGVPPFIPPPVFAPHLETNHPSSGHS